MNNDEKKYLRKHLYFCKQSLECLEKLAKKYKRSESKVIRDMLIKRSNLKTLKFLENEIKTNKKAQFLISSLPGNINQIAHQLNEGSFSFNEYKFYEVSQELLYEVKELRYEIKNNTRLLEEVL